MKKILAVVAAAIMMTGFSPAQAETGYRYWSFWLNNNGWEMAQEGAGTLIPRDGDVQGWRFITTGSDTSTDFAPRSTETFTDICGQFKAAPGKVRVALILDFGDLEDLQDNQCVVINEGDSSLMALSSLYSVRDEGGMVCGINSLPATGCGEEVEITPIPTEVSQDKLPYITMGFLAVLLVLMLLAGRKRSGKNK